MVFRTGFEADGLVWSDKAGLQCKDKSLAQQQFKDECDINTIVERFGLTGTVPENFRMPLTGDFRDAPDFFTAMLKVREAGESFMELPADIRARFVNDPGRLIEFLENPANRDEAVKLGLVALPAEKPRDVVAAVDELAAALKPKA